MSIDAALRSLAAALEAGLTLARSPTIVRSVPLGLRVIARNIEGNGVNWSGAVVGVGVLTALRAGSLV